jgi:hypothetical protein
MKSEALQKLREMALADSIRRHPSLPSSARYIKPYSDKSANQLTRSVIDYIKLMGYQAERIAVMGRYIDGSKVVSDILDRQMRIGSGNWIPGSMQKGSADISATIKGKSVKIEIKIGKDRQSEDQKKYQEAIERAGGVYWIVRSFDEFLNFYNSIT